jgi:hypothetical protein
MQKFKLLITEAAADESKLTHLEHAEDHPINAGAAGFTHAKETMHGVHHAMQGGKSKVSISTKFDGSPSIVAGYHPENGKFFIMTKSGFNKTPKINYTPEDIERNHGHAPGLVSKLKAALQHLPKVMPKEGIYQGDIMHSGGKSKNNPGGDVTTKGGQASFTPNTITYTTKRDGEAEQAAKSKLGVAFHTAYRGSSFQKMKAKYNAGIEGFTEHPDVHLMDVTYNATKAKYTPADVEQYQHHMENAEHFHNELEKNGGYDVVAKHADHMKTYINQTVRTGEDPSVEGYTQHVAGIYKKAADKLKTEAGKNKNINAGKELTDHAENNSQHLENAFQMHKELQQAKNVMVKSLSSHQDYTHTINGKSVKPEGFVAVINNRPTKMNDRHEFNRLNFEKNAR